MSAVRIGPYTLQNGLILAPMAGVTDQPFRQLCKRLGAGPRAAVVGPKLLHDGRHLGHGVAMGDVAGGGLWRVTVHGRAVYHGGGHSAKLRHRKPGGMCVMLMLGNRDGHPGGAHG